MVNLIATSLSKVTSIRWSKELVIPAKRARSCQWKRIACAKLFMPETWNVAKRMYDGCTVRPINASVAAKHASIMLGLLWSRGVFFTAKITKMLSKMVNGQVVVVMIICIINTTCSGSCNCKPSSDTFLENCFKLISDTFVIMFISCRLQLRKTVLLCLAQSKYFKATYNETVLSI